MGQHPVPRDKALEGEVLPPAPATIVAGTEGTARLRAFYDECNRAYREVTEDVGVDPLAVTHDLMRVIMDPWSSPLHIPKRYRELSATPPALPKTQTLVLQTRRA